jgi:hypothetical protein
LSFLTLLLPANLPLAGTASPAIFYTIHKKTLQKQKFHNM